MKILIIVNSVVGKAEQLGFSGSTIIATKHGNHFDFKGNTVSYLTTLEGMWYLRHLGISNDVYITRKDSKTHHSIIDYLFNFILSLKYLWVETDVIYCVSDLLPDALFGFLYKLLHPKVYFVYSCHLLVRRQRIYYKKAILRHLYSFFSQRIFLRLARRLADLTVVPNDVDRKRFIDWKYNKDKVITVYGASDYHFKVDTRKKMWDICFVGNEQAVKGMNILDRLLPKLKDYKVKLIGDRWERIDGFKKAVIVAESKILILPSYHESFSLVAVEAISVGTPVIAFDIPALRSIYKYGVEFVPCYNEEWFLEAIKADLKYLKFLDGMAKQAYEFGKTFNWSDEAHKILEKIHSKCR